jgi:YVTN family beta-propeller protein
VAADTDTCPGTLGTNYFEFASTDGSIPSATIVVTSADSVPGAQYLVVEDPTTSTIVAYEAFTVTTATLSLSLSSGPAGTTVTATATGLAPGTAYSIYFDRTAGTQTAEVTTISVCTTGMETSSSVVTTDGSGHFTCTFTVTASVSPYTVELYQGVTTTPAITVSSPPMFTVTTPMITLSQSTGPNGAIVSVSGSGFTQGVAITFTISSGGTISSASLCSTDGTQEFNSCTFTVTGTPSTSYVITATGSNSLTGGFDSAPAMFTITALGSPAGGISFAKFPAGFYPVGLAANSTALLATEFNDCTTIFSISSTGIVSATPFASMLTPMDGGCEQAYLAISPGFAFFPKGEVFLTQGPYIFEVGPKGGTLTEFADIPAFGLNPDQPTGITFDTIGTFGFLMVVTGGPSGTIETISASGVPALIGSVGYPVEGPAVAPLSFSTYGGDLLVGTGTSSNTTVAVSYPPSPFGVATVSSWPGAWSVSIVPTTTCSYGTYRYFVADESAGAVYAFSASSFTGLAGDALVTSDSTPNPSGIDLVPPPPGSASLFSKSTDLLPGSAFAFCPVYGIEAEVIDPSFVEPYEMAYDPVNGLMYVSDHESDYVYLFNSASTVVGTIKVGTDPADIAFDPANNEMLIANTGSFTSLTSPGSVTYVNAKTNVVIGSVSVGKAPQGLAYDPYNLDVYVANEGSSSLSVINPFNKVVATISTGLEPFGVAFNPLPFLIGSIYVANMGGTLTIITGFKVTTLTLPCAAANIAENFANGEMYVDDYGCSEVSLVLGTKIVTSVGVGAGPWGVAWDPKTGFMYASSTGAGTLTVLNGTKIAITVFLGPGGKGVTYYPENGLVYVAGVLVSDPNGDPPIDPGGDK